MNLIAHISSIFLLIVLQAGCSNQKETTKTADSTADTTRTDTIYVMEEKPGDSLLVGYEQTPCFGRCPVYKMKIYQSGFATFEGINFLDRMGFYSYNFQESQLNAIRENIEDANPAELKKKYERPGVTDLPSRKVTFVVDSARKTVDVVQEEPPQVTVLIDQLQELAEETEWKAYEMRR
jgi:hypothetical protein